MPAPERNETSTLPGPVLPGLALASFSALGAQVAMTRVLSLKYAANQTFLVVSFAVLGLALGAALCHRLRDADAVFARAPATGMLILGGGLLVLLASFHADLSANRQILLIPLPFVGVGLSVAAVFSRGARRAGAVYAVDLGGAALGAFGAAPLLDAVPAPTALVLFAATATAAAVLFGAAPSKRTRAAVLGVVAVTAAAAVALELPGRWAGRIPIHPDRNKEMLAYLSAGARTESDPARRPFLEESRWSAFGRTDVVNDVARAQKKVLYVDGAAGSAMFSAPELLEPSSRMVLRMAFGPSPALRLTPPDRKRTALAIGSGGGRDVMLFRLAGVPEITAVELNPDVIEIAREHRAFNGDVVDGPDVETVVAEGRHFLRSTDGRWDVILLSLPVTKRGEGHAGFALSESYVFTRESIGEYLDHLTDDGQLLVVCHTRQEVGRLVNTYLAACAERDLPPTEAMQRVAIYGDMLLTVVIQAAPQPDGFWRELERETRRVQQAVPDRLVYFVPTASPAGAMTPAFAAVAAGAASTVRMSRISESSYEPDMSPVTDDRPFFFFFTGELPPIVRTVLTTSGLVLVLMLLWGLWTGVGRGAPGAGEQLLWRLAVAGLGVAFMLAEVPLIQRFVLWFGQPTLALGLLLGTLLLATGAGSLLAGARLRGDLRRAAVPVAVLGLVLLLGFLPAQRALFAGANGTFLDALLRAGALTFPLGMLMGVAFPTLLTAAHARGGVSIAWLWGVNGVGSVLGSAAAVALAMLSGYSTALLAAGAIYLAVAAVLVWLPGRAPSRTAPSRTAPSRTAPSRTAPSRAGPTRNGQPHA